jgi:predicted N-formylglutamate amidohydrolase
VASSPPASEIRAVRTSDDATPEEDAGLPFEVTRAMGTSPFLVTCDHASRRLPRRLGTLGLSEGELARHIAWDIGAAGVARALSDELDACLVLQRYSRLAIDSNRPPGRPDSIIACSDGTVIPGNQGLSAAEAERRVREIFHPYHDAIRGQLDQRARAGRTTVLVSLHSFTPTMGGRARPWHLGVLYNRDARVAHRLLAELRRAPELIVGDNEPYAASDATDYTIVEHGERRGLLHVELEVRQDLIGDGAGQAVWAGRLATCLREVRAAMFPE